MTKKNSNLILIYGTFNIVHPGHLRLLRFARKFDGELHIAVASDKIAKDEAHISESLRLEGVLANGWVDHAFISDESPSQLVNRLKPYLVVKGKEYEDLHNQELDVIESYGGSLIFSSGEVSFSSLNLIRKEILESNLSLISNPSGFQSRHNIQPSQLLKYIKKFSEINVCVIGDLILDEYVTCEPLGMSQEDPTLVVKPITSTTFIGGAGIVASHAAGLGAKTRFISIVGKDKGASFTAKELKLNNVLFDLIEDESRPTTLKQRFRAKGKTLLRVSDLAQHSISQSMQLKILERLESISTKLDLIIFSDFNYGVLPQSLVEKITNFAKKNSIFLAADSQSSSQTGDISRYKKMDLITPTEREARLSLRDNEIGLVSLTENLLQISNSQNILLKLGEEGVLVHPGLSAPDQAVTDRIQALNSNPKDVAGAGDSLLVSSALTLVAGGDIWESACIGSIAAAIQVSRLGNSPIQLEEITAQLEGL